MFNTRTWPGLATSLLVIFLLPLAKVFSQAVEDGEPQAIIFETGFRRALLIDFSGPIVGANFSYLNNRLDRAKRDKCDLVLIRLTSPGGDLNQSLLLANRLRDIDWARTIAYVPSEAISGGAIMALGCERIFVSSRALFGDAGPVQLGFDGQFRHAEEKILSYLSTAIGQLAESKGRSSALAQSMVDRDLQVFAAKDRQTGRTVYLTEPQTNDPNFQSRYEIGAPVPETGNQRFLTVAGARACELGLADGIFESDADFLAAIKVETLLKTRINWVDKLVYFLNRPWLTGLLLLLGLVGLYLEIAAPGISFAGLTSAVCFVLFFWSHALGGTSGWLEVLLFLLGVCSILVEIFILPGTTLFGVSGAILILLSLLMATQDFLLPQTDLQWSQFRTNSMVVGITLMVTCGLALVQILFMDSLPIMKRFQLATTNVEPAMENTSDGHAQRQDSQDIVIPVGCVGLAESVLRPSGRAKIQERSWDVIADGDYIDPGTEIEVIRCEGKRIFVRRRV